MCIRDSNLGANYAGFDLNVILQGTGKRDYWISNVLTFPMNGDNFIPLFDGLSDYWMPKDPDNGDWTAVNPNAKYPRLYGNRGNSCLLYTSVPQRASRYVIVRLRRHFAGDTLL